MRVLSKCSDPHTHTHTHTRKENEKYHLHSLTPMLDTKISKSKKFHCHDWSNIHSLI